MQKYSYICTKLILKMKKNPSLFGLFAALLIFVFAFGVYFLFLAKKNEYLVDNPTDKPYYFKINNGTEKIVAPGQYVKIDLEKGKNAIKVYDKDKNLMYDSIFQVNKLRGLLNITHADYYVNTQYYGYNIKKDSLLSALGSTTIDGKPYFGAPKLFKKLYSDDFYYNIDEDYDKLIKNIDKVETRTKIFRKDDYIIYYKEYYNF